MHSSDSSDAEFLVDETGYWKLQLKQALSQRHFRIHATKELAACFAQYIYHGASKQYKAALTADAFTAVGICDRRPENCEAVHELVKAAEKVLPQQKRFKLQAEWKRKMLSLTRAGRKEERAASNNSSDELAASATCLPHDVLHEALSRLDPVSLAHASCVCSRSWRQLSSAPDLWYFWEHGTLFPKAAARTPEGQAASAVTFGRLVAAYPNVLQPFKTGRILRSGGVPGWLHPDAVCHPHHACSTQQRRRQLQQQQRQQELQCHPEDNLDKQQQQHRQLTFLHDNLQDHLNGEGLCYPSSVYSRVEQWSVSQIRELLLSGPGGSRRMWPSNGNGSSSGCEDESFSDQESGNVEAQFSSLLS